MLKIQYQGRNLMEEIHTVEVAVDEATATIHLFDPHSVVWPEYNGAIKSYILSEAFFTMFHVLRQKPFIQVQNEQQIDWLFYRPGSKVLLCSNGNLTILREGETDNLFEEYKIRLN